MNLALIRNELLDKIQTDVFNEEEVNIFIHDLINFLEIEQYISQVIFYKSKTEGNLATYNFETRELKINLELIKLESTMINKDWEFDNPTLFTNLNIIEAVIHEIVHAIQNCLMNESDYPLTLLYYKEFSATYLINDEAYTKYYFSLIYEREAIASSYETVMRMIKTFFYDKKLLDYYSDNLYNLLICDYKECDENLVSPLENLFKNYFKEDVPEVSNIDEYDSMKLGIPLKIESFREFKSKKDKSKKMLIKKI